MFAEIIWFGGVGQNNQMATIHRKTTHPCVGKREPSSKRSGLETTKAPKDSRGNPRAQVKGERGEWVFSRRGGGGSPPVANAWAWRTCAYVPKQNL